MEKYQPTLTIQCKLVTTTLNLLDFGKSRLSLGRSDKNDIVIPSSFVSSVHALITFENDGSVRIHDNQSTNGILINNNRVDSAVLNHNDSIRIDIPSGGHEEAVVIIFSIESMEGDIRWKEYSILDLDEIRIGRDEANHIRLSHNMVSKNHCVIIKSGRTYIIQDLGSTNGTFVNGSRISGRTPLKPNDVIFIGNTKFVYTPGKLTYNIIVDGLRLDAINLVKTVKDRDKKSSTGLKNLLNGISLSIKPMELVAIVGGSGAGKSTLMDSLNGFRKATEGTVLINDDNLIENYEAYKTIMGYVPQQDIVYESLTAREMLFYTANLRMPRGTSKEEMRLRVEQVIHDVELTGNEDIPIKKLSGGQRKRTSIAVELLGDPKLFFLDEPTSGLDPGMERNMMRLLRKLADSGKTVVLITHATLNLSICDKVVFLGREGRLCYFGPPTQALDFFNAGDFTDVYDKINDEANSWEEKFKQSSYALYMKSLTGKKSDGNKVRKRRPIAFYHQLVVLVSRYAKLMLKDTQRFLMLLLQAPVIGLLVAMVIKKGAFHYHENAKQLIFVLICSGIWIGLLNAIQEICKERVVYKRERTVNLGILPYLISKVLVLGVLCIIQSVLLVGVLSHWVDFPANGIHYSFFIEVIFTVFLASFSSSAMGLLISSLANNPDRALGLAPVILIVQILFSGIFFDLNGFKDTISYIAISRWSASAIGASLDLNGLPSAISSKLQIVYDKLYEHTASFVSGNYLALAIIFMTCLLLSVLVLKLNDGRNNR